METAALTVQHLSKRYCDKTAVADVSFSVQPGEVVGLLGPNGAGKTTTINMIFGVLQPDRGSVTIAGHDIVRQRSQALGQTNFAAVYAQLPGNLTVAQNLRVFGLLYGVSGLEQRINEVIEEFDLKDFRDTRCGVLSSGEQTRASLAKALLNRPALLLLDEPTASLDPAMARHIREMIRDLSTRLKTGVLWTSHNMNEVEDSCDRVLLMGKGRILLEGAPKDLPGQHGHQSMEELFIAVAQDPSSLAEGIA